MRLITKRDKIKNVLNEWKKQYPDNRRGDDKVEITKQLSELNLNLVSDEKINKIIGNSTWTELICDECEKDSERVVRFIEKYEDDYESNPCDLCFCCLQRGQREIRK